MSTWAVGDDLVFQRHEAPLADVELCGGTLPSVVLSWLEAGPPDAPAVLVLHGTAGSAQALLTPHFAQPLFGCGAPLDAQRHRILVPDALGCGASSKPSDGWGRRFPAYNYDNQVVLQARWCREVLGLEGLHLIIGYSMGGMQAWRWAALQPLPVDRVIALAASPQPMGGRNWLLRRLLIEQLDSALDEAGQLLPGAEPAVRLALAQFQAATNGGEEAWLRRIPVASNAEALLGPMLGTALTQPVIDLLYQWRSSATYAALQGDERIQVPLLALHAEGDERNRHAAVCIQTLIGEQQPVTYRCVPEGLASTGHGTLLDSSLWAEALRGLP